MSDVIWDFDKRDYVLIADARQKKFELDKLGVPDNDGRRCFSVDADTRRKWKMKGMAVDKICGLRIVPPHYESPAREGAA